MCPQITSLNGCKVTMVAFIWLSSSVCLKCALKLPARADAKSQWSHLFDFCPLCVFWCVLKLWMQRYIGYICLTLVQCVFSNVSVNCIYAEMMYTNTGCTYLIFLHYALSNVSSNRRQYSHCKTQPPASIGWAALSSVFVRRLFVVLHLWHLLSFPLYDVSEHTNHTFSVRIWSWQHVSFNISSVEPSLLLSSLSEKVYVGKGAMYCIHDG